MVGFRRLGRLRLVLIGAGLCVATVAATAVATAQDWHGMHQRHGEMGSPALRQLHLAERLAGVEIYLQITPEQQPQWRAFTAAMLAMMPDAPPPPGDAFAAIDQITTRVQAMAQPAQRLHDATDALKAVLTAEQISKANAIWAAMRPHGMGPHGMGHDDGLPSPWPGMPPHP